MKVTKKEWSPEFRYCRSCLSTDHKHAFLGYCQKCYEEMDVEPEFNHKYRNCLKCGDEFFSKGNRRCENCLRKEATSSVVDRHRYRVNISPS